MNQIVFTNGEKVCCRASDVRHLCRHCTARATALVINAQHQGPLVAAESATGAAAFAQLTDAEQFRAVLAYAWRAADRPALIDPPDPWQRALDARR
jgi:hypothetical protein